MRGHMYEARCGFVNQPLNRDHKQIADQSPLAGVGKDPFRLQSIPEVPQKGLVGLGFDNRKAEFVARYVRITGQRRKRDEQGVNLVIIAVISNRSANEIFTVPLQDGQFYLNVSL